MLENTFLTRVAHKLAWALLLPACLAWSSWQAWAHRPTDAGIASEAPELPVQWNGRPLRPLALSDVEMRFARHFPGSIARMTDGDETLVLRTVERPTRMLHPAVDCYRALGWHIGEQRLQQDAAGELWRCFEVDRAGLRLRVCERIADARGRGFTDTSAWYWAATFGQSPGPWQAITVARPL